MPSTITHSYLATDIYHNLDEKIKKHLTNSALEDFKTYAQGPDLFYFYNIVFPITKKSQSIIKLGSDCHNIKVNELFLNLTKRVKKSQDINQFLFLIGLLTHYISDSTIHPYINYKASLLEKKYLTAKDNHFIIETYLDNYLLKNRYSSDYQKVKIHKICFNLKPKEMVINLLNDSFQEVFNINDIGNCYYKALKDMKNFFLIFRYDTKKIKRKIYNILNIITKRVFRDIRFLSYNFNLDNDTYYLNLNRQEWYNILNKKDIKKASFLDLYQEVVNTSVDRITLLYQYIFLNKELDLETFFENKSYGTGLIIK